MSDDPVWTRQLADRVAVYVTVLDYDYVPNCDPNEPHLHTWHYYDGEIYGIACFAGKRFLFTATVPEDADNDSDLYPRKDGKDIPREYVLHELSVVGTVGEKELMRLTEGKEWKPDDGEDHD